MLWYPGTAIQPNKFQQQQRIKFMLDQVHYIPERRGRQRKIKIKKSWQYLRRNNYDVFLAPPKKTEKRTNTSDADPW